MSSILLLSLLAFGLGHLFVNQFISYEFDSEDNGTLYINIGIMGAACFFVLLCGLITYTLSENKINYIIDIIVPKEFI